MHPKSDRSAAGRITLAIVVFALVAGVALADEAPPRARAARPVIDLGVIAAGDGGEAVFAIENAGGGTLEILDAEPGCSCTLVDFDDRIASGAVGRLRAKLDTSELTGPVTKGIVVTTNDPSGNKLLLTLKATVLGSVELLPQPVIYLRKRGQAPPVGRLLVRQETSEKGFLEIADLEASVATLVVTAERLRAVRPRGGGLPAGKPDDWLIEVRFRDDATLFGRVRESIRFATGLARQPLVVVPVESNFETPVNLSTRKLVLGPGSDGALRGTLFASVRKGVDPSKLRVVARPPGLEVSVEPATERMFKIVVEWSGQKLDAGTLEFIVDDDSVRIPVEWSAR